MVVRHLRGQKQRGSRRGRGFSMHGTDLAKVGYIGHDRKLVGLSLEHVLDTKKHGNFTQLLCFLEGQLQVGARIGLVQSASVNGARVQCIHQATKECSIGPAAQRACYRGRGRRGKGGEAHDCWKLVASSNPWGTRTSLHQASSCCFTEEVFAGELMPLPPKPSSDDFSSVQGTSHQEGRAEREAKKAPTHHPIHLAGFGNGG